MKLATRVGTLLFACVILNVGAAEARLHRKGHHIKTHHVSSKFKHRAHRVRQPVVSHDAGASKSSLRALIAEKAAAHGVSAELAHAVVRVESNYNPRVTGSAGEIGLMQIKYETARGLGYTGTRAALYEPATNLEWGMRYLAGAHKLAGGNLCGTLAKYQGGHGTRGTRTAFNYCGRVRTAMSASGT